MKQSNDLHKWSISTLGELSSEIRYGLTDSAQLEGSHRFIRITDLTDDGKLKEEGAKFVNPSINDSKKYSLENGDLLIARSGSVGRPYLVKENLQAVYASYLIRFRLILDKLNPEFLFYYCLSPLYKDYINANSRGAAINNINAKALSALEIPIPPIEEQKRIVGRIKECLSRVDEMKQLREASRKEAKSLEESIFGDFLEDAKSEGCKVVNLGDILIKSQYGTSAKASVDVEGFPVLRMGNIKSGHLDFSDLKYMKLTDKDLEKYRLNIGDILINRTNSMELVGKSAVFQKQEGDWVFASYLVRLVVDTSKAIPEFVNASINSRVGRAYVYATARRAIGMVNINAKEIAKMPLPLPSLEKQEQIVNRMKEARNATQSLLSDLTIEPIELLTSAILRKAFDGEL